MESQSSVVVIYVAQNVSSRAETLAQTLTCKMDTRKTPVAKAKDTSTRCRVPGNMHVFAILKTFLTQKNQLSKKMACVVYFYPETERTTMINVTFSLKAWYVVQAFK